MYGHIFTASDLAQSRRDVLNQAKSGGALIRDSDGTGLVLVPQQHLELLRSQRALFESLLRLTAIFGRSRDQRRASDYGEFAWLEVFDDDDQREFHSEFVDALMRSFADETDTAVSECVAAWRVTARALANPKVREVLTSPGDESYATVGRPEERLNSERE